VVEAARLFFAVPLLRIDEPMACRAVETGRSVGVLATLPTTLGPTVRLVRAQAARLGKSVTVVEGLARGAYEALLRKDSEAHDRLVLEASDRLAGTVEVLVLAQGSMARMQEALAQRTGKVVLSSPRLGVLALKEAVERLDG
jgi:Asp/Glu/hydantoin racemase